MRIKSLEIQLTNQDIGDIIRRYLPDNRKVRNLASQLTDEGIIVTGEYKKVIWLSFEATVQSRAHGHILELQLTDLKAAGPLGNLLRDMVMGAVAKSVCEIHGIEIAGDKIVCDLQALLAAYGYAAKLSLQIDMSAAELVLRMSGDVDVA